MTADMLVLATQTAPLAAVHASSTVALSAAVIGALTALAGLLAGWLSRPQRAPVPVPVRPNKSNKR